jgi:hypothetical protein
VRRPLKRALPTSAVFPFEFLATVSSLARLALAPFPAPRLAYSVLLLAHLSRDTSPTREAMHTLLNTRLTRAALKAARPARRHIVHALRHHATRTRALGEQWRDAKAVDGIRTWFQTFFSALRVQGGTRRLSLRTLLRKPTPLRLSVAKRAPAVVPHNTSRRPRRLSTSSSGWFAFGFASR